MNPVDNSVTIRLAGRYNRWEPLPEGTLVKMGIADSYCLAEAAFVEKSDCSKRLLDR